MAQTITGQITGQTTFNSIPQGVFSPNISPAQVSALLTQAMAQLEEIKKSKDPPVADRVDIRAWGDGTITIDIEAAGINVALRLKRTDVKRLRDKCTTALTENFKQNL